jgi:hypothetical protein
MMRRPDFALLLILVLTALWRWSATVTAPTVLPDEQVYLRAARHVEAGRSPYTEIGYFYPPPIASLVHAAAQHVGEIGALQLLRGMSLVGLTMAVWLSLLAVSWPTYARALTGILFLALAPAVRIATTLGNAAGLAAGLVLIGLLSWQRRSAAGGVALGLGLAIKPIAPLAPLLLAFHRPQGANRRHQVSALASIAAMAVACLSGIRYLPGLLANARGHNNPYNFSLQRVLSSFGLELPAVLILVIVAVVALLISRRWPLTQSDLLTVTVTASLVGLPILWAHSLLLLLPVQLLAIDRCTRALREWQSLTRRQYVEVILATLALVSTLLSHATGTTHGVPDWGSAIIRMVPLASIPYLGWFAFRRSHRFSAPVAALD